MEINEIISRLRSMAENCTTSPRTCRAAADLLEQKMKETMNKIPYEKRAQVYTNALICFGETAQMVMALEELSECQKEICKKLRGYSNLDHLAEEIADATIMLEQLRLFFGLNDLVCEKMDEKVKRLDALLKNMGREDDAPVLLGGDRYEKWKESYEGAAEVDAEMETGQFHVAG